MKKIEVNAGDRYGRLTVIEEVEPDTHKGKRIRRFECKCECGKTTSVRMPNLRCGQVVSCGCARFKYTSGEYKTPVYRSWDMMKQRCLNPNDPAYHNYGGRGICVCDRWMTFENFLEDMGDRPSLDYSIDRIDTNGDYEPRNCRWATRKEQNRNRRDNAMLAFEGQTLCITEWSEKTGIDIGTIRGRLNLGWSIEDTLTVPPKTRNKHYREIAWNGKSQTLAAWARDTGISRLTIYGRLQNGWSTEEALTIPVGERRSKT